MENEFEVVRVIGQTSDIVLSEEEFEKFVNKYDLPVFKYKYETHNESRKMFTEDTFTIFNGRKICLMIKISQIPPKS